MTDRVDRDTLIQAAADALYDRADCAYPGMCAVVATGAVLPLIAADLERIGREQASGGAAWLHAAARVRSFTEQERSQ